MGIFQNLRFFRESSILWVLFSIINFWKHVLTLNYHSQNRFSEITLGKVPWNMSISGSVDKNYHLEHIVTSTWITIMIPSNFSHYGSQHISPRYFLYFLWDDLNNLNLVSLQKSKSNLWLWIYWLFVQIFPPISKTNGCVL